VDKVDDDVAEAITLASMCEYYHCLPDAGGLFDQDSRVVWLLETVAAAKSEKAEIERHRAGNKS
jgi:hypothetical protein